MDRQSGRVDGPGFRPDIEGVRGIAVLLVLLFHAGLAVQGGFLGVDVFFVISGFLITGLLVREHDRTGRINLPAFYARRVRRLLPVATVTLVVTLVAAMTLVAPLDRPGVATDGTAAALSMANIRFAMSAGDYFATVSTPSPFLHFWSLGVEEQFYLVWPAIILLAARGAGTTAARRIVLTISVVVVVAFAANLWLTDAAANWAFYSLPTRAWQLGVGGLLAIGGTRVAGRLGRLVPVCAWVGLAAIVAASFLFDASLPYPGVASLVPTLATAAVILAGMHPWGPGRILGLAPFRYLGRISYSLYLWHWPILVLAPFVVGAPVAGAGALALCGLSIVVADLSYRFVETPFRHGLPVVGTLPSRTVALGLSSILTVVMVCTGFSWSTASFGASDTVAAASEFDASDTVDAAGAVVAPDDAWVAAAPIPVDDDGNAVVDDQEPGTAAAADPSSPGTAAAADPSSPGTATATPAATHAPDGPIALAKSVKPSLGKARADEDRLRGDGCLAFEAATEPTPSGCTYGDRQSVTTVALVGDSHAAQWFPAIARVAKHEGWKVVVFTKVSCPFVNFPMANTALKREYRECEAWNRNVLDKLRGLKPDLTLISTSRTATHPVDASDRTTAARGAALARYIEAIPGPVGIIVDTPYAGADVPGCLSSHTGDIRKCAIDRATAFTGGMGKAERVAARASGASLVDLTGSVCPSKGACPVVIDNHIVYRDMNHLTATFAASLAPQMATLIVPLVVSD